MTDVPPFCPHRDCPSHQNPSKIPGIWFQRKGFRLTKVCGPVPRFQCRLCRRGFSSRTFDIDYWTHRSVDYQIVLDLLAGGSGLRQSCRTLGVSTRLLANRHIRLSRQSLALHSQTLSGLPFREPMVFDGFESFAFSQYFPNNLHLLVTKESQFILGVDAAVLRRKGRMTKDQKARRKALEQTYRAPPGAIRSSCKKLLSFACHRAFGAKQLPIQFLSDEKKDYRLVLDAISPYQGWREGGVLVHRAVSSRAARSLGNPLFAVNYLDRQLRKDLSEHVRETVRFARRIEHSLERLMIYAAHHNYFKVFRTRSEDQELSHAQVAGLERTRVEELKRRFFRERALGWREDLEAWQTGLWKREVSVPVHRVTPLARHLMTA